MRTAWRSAPDKWFGENVEGVIPCIEQQVIKGARERAPERLA
jgi:hypothetical protein